MSPVFGKSIYRLGTVVSTQDFLKNLFMAGAPSMTIVVAEEQTGGRGRRDNSWDSRAGMGLWTSILVQPGGPEEFWTWTPLWAGLTLKRAVAEMIAGSSDLHPDEIRLKWPNDLMIGVKKLGGILSERVQNGSDQAVILGLGINLKHNKEDFPLPLQDTAISLWQVMQESFLPDTLLGHLINQLEGLHPLLNPVNRGLIREIWLNHAWGLGSHLALTSVGKRYEGIFTGLGEYGEIQLRSNTGDTAEFATAEHIERLE